MDFTRVSGAPSDSGFGASGNASTDASATATSGASSPPSTGERVTRPDPGLGRGIWEAPPWAIYGVASASVALAATYALVRSGWASRAWARRRRRRA